MKRVQVRKNDCCLIETKVSVNGTYPSILLSCYSTKVKVTCGTLLAFIVFVYILLWNERTIGFKFMDPKSNMKSKH